MFAVIVLYKLNHYIVKGEVQENVDKRIMYIFTFGPQ